MYLVTSQHWKSDNTRKWREKGKVTVWSKWCHNVGHPNKVSGWIASSCPGHFLPGMEKECWARWLFLHRPARLYEFSIKMADREREREKGGERGVEANMAAKGLICVHVRDLQDKTESRCLADKLGSTFQTDYCEKQPKIKGKCV